MEHAMNRALERYGLKLSYSDVVDIAMECQKGYGRITYMRDGRERHLVMCRGKAVVVVYEPPDNGKSSSKYGDVITILPRESIVSKPSSHMVHLRRDGPAPVDKTQRTYRKRKR